MRATPTLLLTMALSLAAAACAAPPSDLGAEPDYASKPVAERASHARTAGRVSLCHVTGNPDQVVAIEVSASAVDAHLAHGDSLAQPDGSCAIEPCDALPDGAMFCDGSGFVTCADGGEFYRDCAPGTTCYDQDDDTILCDWPAVE